MTTRHITPIARVAGSLLVVILISGTFAFAQPSALAPPQSEALSAALKANPKLVKDLAKELKSTPEEAAGTAGALFGIAKSFLSPDDFALLAKAVPGMEALVAVVPPDAAVAPANTAVVLTPGFATSSAPPVAVAPTTSSQTPVLAAAPTGVASAISILSKMGINPAMIGKAIPFLMDYVKKNGGKAIEGLLGQVFKTGK